MKSENTDDNNSTFYFVNKATDVCIVIKISKQLQLRSGVAKGVQKYFNVIIASRTFSDCGFRCICIFSFIIEVLITTHLNIQ